MSTDIRRPEPPLLYSRLPAEASADQTAPDGTDAVARMEEVEEHYYDAILMDVQMPIMNGYEATRTIRALAREDVKTMPIIAMTANALEEDKEAALMNGMNAHIPKPFNMDDFIEFLTELKGENDIYAAKRKQVQLLNQLHITAHAF